MATKDLFAPPSEEELKETELFAAPSEQELAATRSVASEQPETPGYLSTGARAAGEIALADFDDELVAALQNPTGAYESTLNLFRDKPVETEETKAYDAAKQLYEQETELGKEAHPTANYLGKGVGLLASLAPMGAVSKGIGAGVGLAGKVIPGVGLASKALPASRLGTFLKAAPTMSATGAGIGALQAAGAAEKGKMAEDAASAAKIGAFLGPVVEGTLGHGIPALHEATKKVNPTYERMTKVAGDTFKEGVDFLDENLLRKILSEKGEEAAGTLSKTTKQIRTALDESRSQAAPMEAEAITKPALKELQALKTVKVDGGEKEQLQQLSVFVNDRLSDNTKKLVAYRDELVNLRLQKQQLEQSIKEATNKGLYNLDESVAQKSMASLDSMQSTKANIENKITKIENTARKLQQDTGDLLKKADEKATQLQHRIDNPIYEASSTYKGDVAKLETKLGEIPLKKGMQEGKLPADSLKELNRDIRDMQALGDESLKTGEAQKIANKMTQTLTEHFDETAPFHKELRGAMSESLTAADMLEGNINKVSVDEAARDVIDFTKNLLKTEEQSKGSFQARELFDKAENLLRSVKEKAQTAGRDDIVQSVDTFTNQVQGTKKAAERWELGRFLTNPNIPFTKSLPVRASAITAGLSRTPAKFSSSFLKTASGQQWLDSKLADPTVSPVMQKYLQTLKGSQDEGKRKAIIKILQDNPVYRSMLPSGEEDGN